MSSPSQKDKSTVSSTDAVPSTATTANPAVATASADGTTANPYEGYDYSAYYDPNAYYAYYGYYPTADGTTAAAGTTATAGTTDPSAYYDYSQYYDYSSYYGTTAGATSSTTAGVGSSTGVTNDEATAAFYQHQMTYDPSLHDKINEKKKKEKKKGIVRAAGGEVWKDPTLAEWDQNDFRLFVGDLGGEVDDELLTKSFSKYPSFLKGKVVRDARSEKSKGYGFVSFKDPDDFVKAMREMNGKYIGNRPCKLRKSTWNERSVDVKAFKALKKAGGGITKKR